MIFVQHSQPLNISWEVKSNVFWQSLSFDALINATARLLNTEKWSLQGVTKIPIIWSIYYAVTCESVRKLLLVSDIIKSDIN